MLLAGPEPVSIIGNLAGDFVKGPIDESWPRELRAGIQLHRRIDTYTDTHKSVRGARRIFSPGRRRFAGVILDVAFDYFLCRHWSRFHDQARRAFIEHVYQTLSARHADLPDRLRDVAPIMIQRDWLTHCETLAGAGSVLNRIATRSHRARPLEGAVEEVEQHLPELEATFLDYFPELIAFAEAEKARLKSS